MSGLRNPGRESAPLACALGLALLAASAALGHAQTADTNPKPKAESSAKAAGDSKSATTAPATSDKPAAGTVAPAAAPTKQTAPPKPAVRAVSTMSSATPPATGTTATKTATRAMSPASSAKTGAAKATKSAESATPGAAGASAASQGAGTQGGPAGKSGGEALRGGQEGTVFKSLTIEGEDRIRVDFARPELKLDIELENAPGLDWGSAADVLNRANRDLQAPLVEMSAKQGPQYLARPWLNEFATGPVARFRPNAEGVERWKLVVVDSKGAPVATFTGKGDPPREIAWDGRGTNGTPVTPGLTYSYVFEAHDRAGNKRNVVGQGFTVSALRLDSPEGPTLLFSGAALHSAAGASIAPAAPGASEGPAAAPILLEAASWLNQSDRLSQPIRVTATARSHELAETLAGSVKRALAPLVLGDPARLDAVAVVEPDAPEAGTLSIAPAK